MMLPLKKTVIMTNEDSTNNNNNNENDKVTQTYLINCNICGQSHNTHECLFLQNLHHIKDTPLISRARQTLPNNLEITKMADGTTSILTKCNFERGVTFGPFQARRTWAINPTNHFSIKLFGASSTDTYYLDYSDEENSNWMCFILPATNAKEQNLICYQFQQDIYYTVMRDIPPGEELRVWYAPYYALKMNVLLYNRDIDSSQTSVTNHNFSLDIDSNKEAVEILNKEIAQELAERLPAARLGAISNKEYWTCHLCSADINTVVSYAKHLMEHYKPRLGAVCNVCNKKFHNNSMLEKHKAMDHPDSTKDTTSKMTDVNDMSAGDIVDKLKEKTVENTDADLFDTSINISDLLTNGNLIENNSLNSILENQCLNINISSIDSILAENISDAVKFHVDELASELSRDMHLDAEKKREIFECDICNKKFKRLDYLHRHLRKHTGEFICSSCLTVFARKENLLSHVCSTNQNIPDNYQCPYCHKSFMVKKYLKRHMGVHLEFNRCKWCRNVFANKSDADSHKCNGPQHVCTVCNKAYVRRAQLTKHMKIHTEPKEPKEKTVKKKVDEKPAICEKCGDVFKNTYSLKQHLRSHGERMYECDICQRRFHRIGVLKEHKQIHESAQIPCEVCGKMLKSKKALSVHVLLHGNKKFQCDKCDKSFFQRCNYIKHYKHTHTEKPMHKCKICTAQFVSEADYNKHIKSHEITIENPSEFTCSTCNKSFHGANQLKRHKQTSHSGFIYRCPYCSMTARHRHSMRRHFERQHKNLTSDWNQPGFVNKLAEKSSDDNNEVTDHKQNDADEHEPYDADATADNSVDPLLLNETVVETFSQLPDNQVSTATCGNSELLLQPELPSSTLESVQLPLVDVPQLSIADTDAHLADTMLNNTCIFSENGDILFYVLENSPDITGY